MRELQWRCGSCEKASHPGRKWPLLDNRWMDEHLIRRANLLALFKAFVEAQLDSNPASSIAGLDRVFSAQILVHNTAFSALKSGRRPIGPVLARQIEATCAKPSGWLDEDHGASPESDERSEKSFLKLARRVFKRATPEQRDRLNELLHEQLAGMDASRSM